MKYFFHPQAEDELDEAVRFYEGCRHGLGLDFAEEVYATIARIGEFPDASFELSKKTRRCLVNKFPYGVIFQIKSGTLRIIAIANLHRRPGYWRGRIRSARAQ